MSVDILYRPLFVRLSDNTFIPMIEQGANNCWECGCRRRARTWYNTQINLDRNKISYTRDEIMSGIELMVQQEKKKNPECTDVEESLGYYASLYVNGYHRGRNSSARDFFNFYKRGFKNSVPFGDQDIEYQLSLCIGWCTSKDDEGLRYDHFNTTNETELREKWDELIANGFHPYVTIHESVGNYFYNRFRQKRAKKSVSTPQEFSFEEKHIMWWPEYEKTAEVGDKLIVVSSNKVLARHTYHWKQDLVSVVRVDKEKNKVYVRKYRKQMIGTFVNPYYLYCAKVTPEQVKMMY